MKKTNKDFRFTYQKRSKVLQIANALVKQGWAFGEAQKRGWEVVRFMVAIQQGKEVVLRFKKFRDPIPQQRIASAINSDNYERKEGARKYKESPLQVKYFDHHRNAPRSFNAGRFVGFKMAA